MKPRKPKKKDFNTILFSDYLTWIALEQLRLSNIEALEKKTKKAVDRGN